MSELDIDVTRGWVLSKRHRLSMKTVEFRNHTANNYVADGSQCLASAQEPQLPSPRLPWYRDPKIVLLHGDGQPIESTN